MYPLIMKPYFRHGAMTPWGGSRLRDWFGKDAPDDGVGESLEVSALPGMESVILNGELAGCTFPKAIEKWGTDLTGTEGVFPLLLKLLDANDMLSVQVHPDDTYAAEHDGKLGKTEAWVVLSADPGAKLAYGLDLDGRPLKDVVAANDLESVLHWEIAKPGDVLYIPHGMVHALGGGIQVYEIQQSSDATYRFWDWGRLGKDGKPRELHTEKATDVSRPDVKLGRIEGTTVIIPGGSQTYFIADANFELSRLNVSGKMPLESGRMAFLTALGQLTVTWPEGSFTVDPFETVVVPAALEGVVLESTGPVMMSRLPDRAALREILGYRAENMMGLVD